MKKSIAAAALFVYLFAAYPVCSQNAEYSFSEEFKTIRKHKDWGFRQLDKNLFAEVYYRHEKGLVFQLFDDKFNAVKKTELAQIKIDTYAPEGLFHIKNNFFWLYSTWERSEGVERLWALPLDKQTYKLGDNPIRLSESDKLGAQGYYKYRFYYSRDKSRMLMTYRLKPKEKKDRYNKDVIGFNLYDDQMKTLYSREIEMPYTEAEMDILAKEVDSKGNIYIFASVALNNSIDGETKENKGRYRYELMRLNQKTNKMEFVVFALENKFLKDYILTEDLGGSPVIVGYYSNFSNGGTDGTYIARLEFTDKGAFRKFNTTYYEFPNEILKSYESERTKRRMEKREKEQDLEASNLNFRKVVFDEDGGITFIGEEYYVVQHTTTSSNGSTRTTYTYYYESILVLKANKDGKTEWCQKIPKYQKGGSTADLGFFSRTYKGNHYFFYLDNAKNAKLTSNERPAQHVARKGGILTCVKIDPMGRMTKQYMFDIKKEGIKLFPASFESVGDNIVIDRLKESRKNSKIIRLSLL